MFLAACSSDDDASPSAQDASTRVDGAIESGGVSGGGEGGSMSPIAGGGGEGGEAPEDAAVMDGMTSMLDGASAEAGADAANLQDAACAGDCEVRCEALDVIFVVDGSASMCTPFGPGTRWQAVRSALIGPTTGLIPRIASSAQVGLFIYDGTISVGLTAPVVDVPPMQDCELAQAAAHMEGECPQLIAAPLLMDNADYIASVYPNVEPGGSTPTDRAMTQALNHIGYGPDRTEAFVLITGGRANDLCNGGQGGEGEAQQLFLLQAVDGAAANGIKTFAINLEPEDPVHVGYMDEVAQHGQSAQAYTVTSEAELRDALASVMSALGCEGDL